MLHPPCDCRQCGSVGDRRMHPSERWDAPHRERPRPPKPKPPCHKGAESVLMQKIVSCEKRNFPNACTELTLEGVPPCAQPPYTLVMVQQSGAQPWWSPLENHLDGRLRIRVSIPVCCQVRDACGKLFTATSVVTVEASLRPLCPMSECWRHNLYVVPFVRLCGTDCTSDCATFAVRLEICMDIYLLRPEPCMMRRAEPPCPDLPLYPQPVKPPPYWQQCPEAPGPCGWPRQG